MRLLTFNSDPKGARSDVAIWIHCSVRYNRCFVELIWWTYADGADINGRCNVAVIGGYRNCPICLYATINSQWKQECRKDRSSQKTEE